MPLQWQPAEVVLFEGLDQKTDAKLVKVGKLLTCENVEFDKQGALNKRRGYSKVTVTTEALGNTPEETFMGVATFEDELVIFGCDRIYALASRTGDLGGSRYIVERGPMPRGNIRAQDVVCGRIGKNEVEPQ